VEGKTGSKAKAARNYCRMNCIIVYFQAESIYFQSRFNAGIAQLVEQLIRNQ
jgi:hypothetical protein